MFLKNTYLLELNKLIHYQGKPLASRRCYVVSLVIISLSRLSFISFTPALFPTSFTALAIVRAKTVKMVENSILFNCLVLLNTPQGREIGLIHFPYRRFRTARNIFVIFQCLFSHGVIVVDGIYSKEDEFTYGA